MVVSVHWGMYHGELFPRLVEGSWDGKTRYISTLACILLPSRTQGKFIPRVEKKEMAGLSRVDSFLCHKSTIFLWALLLGKGLFCEFAMVMDGYALKKDEIAGGGYHWLALTGKVTLERHDEGQVLSWGFDGHGQLGHSSIQCQKIPVVIDALADQHVIHVTCGGSSLAAITVLAQMQGNLFISYNSCYGFVIRVVPVASTVSSEF
ncbi:hypothetical protein Peur_024458 [Populus x canadensis]